MHIHATDGDIGHVHDLLIEEDTWSVRYFVVDTSNWWFGKHVLISPDWIERFDRAAQNLNIAVTRTAVKGAPEYEPDKILSRTEESELYRRHGRHPYW